MGKSHQTSSKRSREFSAKSNASIGFSSRNKNKQHAVSKAQTTSIASIGSARLKRPECAQCGKRHFSECHGNERSCFKCGSLDHFIRSCPEMVEKDKDQCEKLGNTPSRGRPHKNPISRGSNRGTPRDAAVRSKGREPVKTYAICVCKEVAPPDVITVDCERKVIELKCESRDVFRVESGEADSLPVIISSLTTERYLRKWCETYLVFVLNTQVSEMKIKSVLVVCEYPNVFPKELPGLPPTREVEFGIELVPSAVLISISLYQMTPTKLKELKV
ncbi:uncharacterized protein [Gossypium hirsutum]|uniref:CCHC-type domain-containing protein n=1 Tax=Gossypium hirsutum TaxID=3635 RepID=A0A1U8I2K7_GOSHI|nr:uncharacterized protein LOC107889866 [Gossypium hirsutum]